MELRESVERATRVAAAESAGGGVPAGQGARHRFVAAEWARHRDGDGHFFFVHGPTGAATYAMPWVLCPSDLGQALHDANDPGKWRAVSTGRRRADGTPLVLYYNKATKQTTFDTPMFATWKEPARRGEK